MERLFSLLLTPQDAPCSGSILARIITTIYVRTPLLANAILSAAVAALYYGVAVVREWLFFVLVGSGLAGAIYLAYRVLRQVSRRGWLDAVVLLGGLGALLLAGALQTRTSTSDDRTLDQRGYFEWADSDTSMIETSGSQADHRNLSWKPGK
jgi:hypothetical protein